MAKKDEKGRLIKQRFGPWMGLGFRLLAPLKVLRELPPRLAFARQVFNEAGSAYNDGTQQFPTRLLRSVLGFVRAGLL